MPRKLGACLLALILGAGAFVAPSMLVEMRVRTHVLFSPEWFRAQVAYLQHGERFLSFVGLALAGIVCGAATRLHPFAIAACVTAILPAAVCVDQIVRPSNRLGMIVASVLGVWLVAAMVTAAFAWMGRTARNILMKARIARAAGENIQAK